jgi:demethylmenaquinone methyltransferase / 2-methoxy-6-polyprenyl-1,4-benzoquinol methylase
LAASTRTQHARELFAPLGPTYDRYARLLSFGQDPRWRAYLVSRIPAEATRVADVASGTAAVSIALARAASTRTVVGVDQSAEMLAAGRARVERAGLSSRIELREGRAEALPFDDAEFDALTFTYLLRYVDDPAATMRELARVLRPGGRIASLEFGVPSLALARWAWRFYTAVGLPALGRLASREWSEVGRFLGPSIRGFYSRHPLERIVAYWREAGLEQVTVRRMSLGGGVVISARRVGSHGR